MRFRLSDFDNSAVACAVPIAGLYGEAIRRLALADWGDGWLLLNLDHSFEYHGQPQQQVLIRSRLLNYSLEHDPWTSVFMLLVPNAAVLAKDALTSKDFEHVTWATATALPDS